MPAEEEKGDPLLKMTVRKDSFKGVVEGIERGTISKERAYRVRYEDGDLEHYTRKQVIQYRDPRRVLEDKPPFRLCLNKAT